MALQIINRLLSELHAQGINYCHWKSNEHLQEALNGDTDLDILFDKEQEKQVVDILVNHQFHLFEAVWYRRYKGIVDYIGFDKDSGKIVHVHTHFNLDIGEVGIKSYRLPWEKLILENKIFVEPSGIFTSSPEIEYLLLVVRTAFKHDKTDQKSNKRIAKHFNREAAWLYPRLQREKLHRIASQTLDAHTVSLIEAITSVPTYDEPSFLRLKEKLTPYFKKNRLLSSREVFLLKIIQYVKRLQIKLSRLFRMPYRIKKRSLPYRGVVVSIMGPDGAGKSTQTKEVTKELAKKVDVKFMYMGSGDGPMSLQRKIISKFIGMAARAKGGGGVPKRQSPDNANNTVSQVNSSSGASLLKQILLSFKAASLGFEKKKRLRQIERARMRGEIVICDRYPQTSVMGYNDGPKLYSQIESSNGILRRLANYEYSCYKLAEKIPPDLVIKLTGSLDTLHTRRPEMTREEIEKKQNGILALQFTAPCETVSLDIEQPVDKIKGAILDAISQRISKNSLGKHY